MKVFIKALSASCFFLFFACAPKGELFEEAICIENITLIDAENGLKEGMTIIVKGVKILKVFPTAQLKLAPENQIIDGTGKYIIPGLWDAHVHFAYIEELAPAMFNLFLAYGVTSVRDTGGEINFVKKWKDKAMIDPSKAPRVMIAGPLLDGDPNVYDGSTPSRPPLSVKISSVEDAVALVDKYDSLGVDLLKAYEMLTPEQFEAIIKRAKEKGLKVTGHVPLSMDVISASNIGLNSMEHLRNLEMSTASNSDELLERRRKLLEEGKEDEGGVLRARIHAAQRTEAIQNTDEAITNKVLQTLAKNETWQIPTLSIMTAMAHRPFLKEDWLASFDYLPQSVAKTWKDGVKRVSAIELTEDRKRYPNWMFETTQKVHEAGIDIMAGTDCPIFFLTPGLSLHEELFLLSKSSLSNMDILKTATLNPARYFGLEHELGTIAEGMIADLLILEANPLTDIQNTRKINTVFKNGKAYNRTALDQMLESLKNQ